MDSVPIRCDNITLFVIIYNLQVGSMITSHSYRLRGWTPLNDPIAPQ